MIIKDEKKKNSIGAFVSELRKNIDYNNIKISKKGSFYKKWYDIITDIDLGLNINSDIKYTQLKKVISQVLKYIQKNDNIIFMDLRLGKDKIWTDTYNFKNNEINTQVALDLLEKLDRKNDISKYDYNNIVNLINSKLDVKTKAGIYKDYIEDFYKLKWTLEEINKGEKIYMDITYNYKDYLKNFIDSTEKKNIIFEVLFKFNEYEIIPLDIVIQLYDELNITKSDNNKSNNKSNKNNEVDLKYLDNNKNESIELVNKLNSLIKNRDLQNLIKITGTLYGNEEVLNFILCDSSISKYYMQDVSKYFKRLHTCFYFIKSKKRNDDFFNFLNNNYSLSGFIKSKAVMLHNISYINYQVQVIENLLKLNYDYEKILKIYNILIKDINKTIESLDIDKNIDEYIKLVKYNNYNKNNINIELLKKVNYIINKKSHIQYKNLFMYIYGKYLKMYIDNHSSINMNNKLNIRTDKYVNKLDILSKKNRKKSSKKSNKNKKIIKNNKK